MTTEHSILGMPCVRTTVCAVWLFLAGCADIHTGSPRTTAPYSETPISANFQTTAQPKLQAGLHWMTIADDTGRAVVDAIRKSVTCAPSYDRCRLVYVRPPATVTEFSRAFHSQLITTLVKQGVSVSKNETELSAEIDVQPVLFSANRPQYRYSGVPVELGPGVWAIRDVVGTTPSDTAITPPWVDALHWFRSEFAAGQTPRAEILVTVSIGDRNRYLARTTNAYYVADSDRRLYDQEICSLFSLCPTAAAGTVETRKPAAPVIRVTGDCPNRRPCEDEAAIAPPATPFPARKP